MSLLAHVVIHPSQFPDAVRNDLIESLRSRSINHKFHYDSVKQTQKWLALHQAYSPSRTDPNCAAIYDRSFEETARRIQAGHVQLVGLGCGGGQKDTRLLTLLAQNGKIVSYLPSDVSTAMVLVARHTALEVVSGECCFPLVCDLASTDDLPQVIDRLLREGSSCEKVDPTAPNSTRLFTFFGMLPNFEPQAILPKLQSLLRPSDLLLLSANLAPGPDYRAGIRQVLPLYENVLTRDWLLTFLLDLGIERADGELAFCVEGVPAGSGLKRIAAYFQFARPRALALEGDRFVFSTGERLRLFFSYRHTPQLVERLMGEWGLRIIDQRITDSQEEGVFLITPT